MASVSLPLEKLLLEMKDTSELMLDLAYSALLYDSGEIARQVIELEERVDHLDENVQQRAVERAIEDKDVDKALAYIRLADSIESIADSAVQIADVVLRDIEPHPIVAAAVGESDTTIKTFKVSKESRVIGKALGNLKIASETGMWIIAIKRGDEWIYGPDEGTTLEVGDLLVARGPVEGEAELRKFLGGR